MLKDPVKAKRELKKYLRLVEKVPSGELTPAGNPKMKVRGTHEQITQQRYVAELIYEQLFVEAPRHFNTTHVHYALVEIERGVEIAQLLGTDDAPTLSAKTMHPWVWSAAASHWASDAHGAAVWAAGINVNSRLQKKLQRFNLGETKLIQEAFSLKPPEPDKPRLRLCDRSNPDLFNDLHVGAMNFGAGLYAAVRNPINHVAPDEHDLSTQEALECLSAFSLFARWVDRATVRHYPEED